MKSGVGALGFFLVQIIGHDLSFRPSCGRFDTVPTSLASPASNVDSDTGRTCSLEEQVRPEPEPMTTHTAYAVINRDRPVSERAISGAGRGPAHRAFRS